MARGDVIKRLIEDMCRDLSRAEVIRQFGMAWRGGKLDAAYLSNRIPFRVLPLQNDTVLLSIPANSDSATQSIAFAPPYPGTTLSSAALAGANSVFVASIASLWPGQKLRLTHAGVSEKVVISSINPTNKQVTLTATLANAYSGGDPAIVLPDVALGSGDIGWDATRANITNLGFDLTLARRVSLANTEQGSSSVHFAIGDTFHDVGIAFPVPYASPPVVVPNYDDPAFPVTLLSLTGATVGGVTVWTGATLRVTHVNTSAAGTLSTNTADIKPSAGVERTDDASTGITATNGSGVGTSGGPSSNITGDPLTRTDPTFGAESPTTSTVSGVTTGTGSTGHVHQENTAASYTQNANTAGAGAAHTHTVPDHSHAHHHEHDLSAHTHGTPDHTHPLTDPNHHHGLTDPGHTHTFTGQSTAVTVASDHTILWNAFGNRTAPAVTKEASWMAVSR